MTAPITVKSHSETNKDLIVADYTNKLTIKVIAERYSTSARTVGRILVERGLAQPVARLKDEAYRVMKILEDNNISPDELETALTHPEIPTPPTKEAVQIYLNQCSQEQLAKHFYASGLIKLAEITQEANAKRKQQQAALFRPIAQHQEPFRFAAAH